METLEGSPPKTPTFSPSEPLTTHLISPKTIRWTPLKSTSPANSPTKSVWDPEDDEFPDWPGTYRSAYGTFKPNDRDANVRQAQYDIATVSSGSSVSYLKLDDDSDDFVRQKIGLREQEHTRDVIAELSDPIWSNPWEADAHDRLMQRFYRWDYHTLPGDYPARHMHVLIPKDIIDSTDQTTEYAKPRLCDGVATVLYETSQNCLDDFLNPTVKVFEWRKTITLSYGGTTAVIRRDGNEVWCGTYRNHGFKYLWKYFVKSRIHYTGKWSDVFAGGRGTTAVLSSGPSFHDFEPLNNEEDIDRTDPHCALYAGRELAHRFLEGRVWEYDTLHGGMVEWEADEQIKRGTTKSIEERSEELVENEEARKVLFAV